MLHDDAAKRQSTAVRCVPDGRQPGGLLVLTGWLSRSCARYRGRGGSLWSRGGSPVGGCTCFLVWRCLVKDSSYWQRLSERSRGLLIDEDQRQISDWLSGWGAIAVAVTLVALGVAFVWVQFV